MANTHDNFNQAVRVDEQVTQDDVNSKSTKLDID
jgi:hypothetical protein